MTLAEFPDARLDEDDLRCGSWHDPARALREIAAKRAILAEHAADGEWCRVCNYREPDDVAFGISLATRAPYPCLTVRHELAVWADHPDYDAGWKP